MKFNKKVQIKVIGDIMLDQWIYGKYGDFSAEAKFKIYKSEKTYTSLGGVGNLCKNLKNLNCNFLLFTSIAKDNYGNLLKKKLKENQIKYKLLGKSEITTEKKRFFINNSQIFRVDSEIKTITKNKNSFYFNKINKNEIVIISDYKKGVINKNLHKYLIKKKCLTFIDPKNKPNFFKNAFLVKPNLSKFEEWCGKFSRKKAFDLLKKMNWQWLIITSGHRGVHVFNKLGIYNHYKVKKIKKPNVIGAGDIFFSALIHKIVKGYDVFTASELSSYAATRLVSINGDRAIKKNDFKKKIVFANGVFDILHSGHIDLLKFAKSLGNKLIVGINSDKSVKLNKGKTRPYNKIHVRVKNLKQLKFIDEIIIFNKKKPDDLINKLKPDVIIKGDDYKFSQVAGRNTSNVILFKKTKNISSTSIIKSLK